MRCQIVVSDSNIEKCGHQRSPWRYSLGGVRQFGGQDFLEVYFLNNDSISTFYDSFLRQLVDQSWSPMFACSSLKPNREDASAELSCYNCTSGGAGGSLRYLGLEFRVRKRINMLPSVDFDGRLLLYRYACTAQFTNEVMGLTQVMCEVGLANKATKSLFGARLLHVAQG